MTSISATPEVAAIHTTLHAWYRANGRHHLPWRLTRDPYAVLVSEIMLQQTQVERVIPSYHAWLQRWPTFHALAAATPADVITAWRGLGYNRRALALHAAARIIVQDHSGTLPSDPAQLRALPGVGPYTEAALRCFVHDQAVPLLDTNIARVIGRHRLGAPLPRDASRGPLESAARALIPPTKARDHNLALMDLGALVCSARSPDCERCPLANTCTWRAAGCPPSAQPPRQPSPPFQHTARFARGRLVDHLRRGPAHRAELQAILPARHRPKLDRYLASLERDGLVFRLENGSWALPPG